MAFSPDGDAMQSFTFPVPLVFDLCVTYSAKVVGAILYSQGGKTVAMTLAELAEASSVSIATVQKALSELKRAGYIQEIRRLRHNRKCYILLAASSTVEFITVPMKTLDLGLTPSTYCILLFLYHEARMEKPFPSLSNISKALGIAISTVCRGLKELGGRQQIYEQVKRDLL